MTASRIPVHTPRFCGNEKRYLAECIESGWVSSEGPFVERFEQAFALRTGRRQGIAVSSGSAALEIAMLALGIGAGDEVILPSFTIIACAAAILRTGATPVPVDSDPDSWCMDPATVEGHISPKTRAILAVHIYGLPVNLMPVLELCHKHQLHLVEDAAQALGLDYRGRPCGGFGVISTFSFYANKLVTTGEGGMLVTDDEELARRCRSLRNLGFATTGHRFMHEEAGWNYRMSNLQAAVGVAQLECLDQAVAIKRSIGRAYTQALGDHPSLQLPLDATDDATNLYWAYGVVLRDDASADVEMAMRRLVHEGIGCRPFFWPIHQQPVYRKAGYFNGLTLPVAERLARRGFYIPTGLDLTTEQVQRVAATLWSCLD